jgi:hypothetical protein
MKRFLMLLAAELLVFCVLAGCARTIGPRVLIKSQTDFNNAVQKVVSEEVLLNIVRRRYYEAPQFVAIANITTQITNSVGAGVSGSGQFFRGGGVQFECLRSRCDRSLQFL